MTKKGKSTSAKSAVTYSSKSIRKTLLLLIPFIMLALLSAALFQVETTGDAAEQPAPKETPRVLLNMGSIIGFFAFLYGVAFLIYYFHMH